MPVQNHTQLCAVTLLGNLVATPDIRYTANPVMAVTEITLATHTKWLDKSTQTFKEWTSYHHVKVIGPLVEQTLLHAQKGDLILVNGYLSDTPLGIQGSKPVNEVITATFVQAFAKGYSQSINQIYCSASIDSDIQLMKTGNNKDFAQTDVIIKFETFSSAKQKTIQHSLSRKLHVWGKQALTLHEKSNIGDTLVIEGKINYLTAADKAQFIDGKTLHLFKN